MEYKLKEWDNLHYDGTKLDGHNKPFRAIISERELGKTTWFWCKKAWKAFCSGGRTTLVLRRLISDITDVYINDIQEVINKFSEEPIEFTYKKGNIGQGVVDVYVEDKLFLRVLGMSNPMSRIKSLIVRNLKYIVFDEFICNIRLGEKYLKDEAFKFKEIYNTFQRESNDLVCYFLGNPYSMYNPYFVWWDVNTKKLLPGSIVAGDNYVVECGMLSDELRKVILERNPLYKFDDSYTKYAFFGGAINDQNINLVPKCPDGYKLKHIFRIEGKYLYFYKDTNAAINWNCSMWCCVKNEYNNSANRLVFAVDFNDLVSNTVLYNKEDKAYFEMLKQYIRFRRVGYETIEASYLAEEIYELSK